MAYSVWYERVWWVGQAAALLVILGFGFAEGERLHGAEPAEAAAQLRLVPFPKKVQLAEGTLSLKRPWVLELPADMDILAQSIGEEMRRAGLDEPRRLQREDKAPMFRLLPAGTQQDRPVAVPPAFRPNATEEDYWLRVGPEEVVAWGKGPAGLFYAGQTLCQLLRANRSPEDRIACLVIEDWPSLRWRCFQDDMTQGPSTKLPSLQRSIQLGAYLKHNLWTYYMEYQYAFRKHPDIGPPDGSLQPEELKALVEFAKKYYTDVLGNQQSFGHFGWILRHEKYAPLRETPDVLTPVREETYRLLDDLYSEVCPLLPFEMFNVCCDETWGLGKGPSKALADKIGVGGVYVQHIRRLHAILRDKYKKRMMMWGDIILQHPDQLEQIPKDVIMLTWGYGPAENFEHQIIPFRKAGYEFFVCPGISNWSRILPDFDVAMKNIQNFVRDGAKHGALGMINTDWEDDGEALQGYRWHGHAWGGECAWNAGATRPEDFQRRIGAVLFGERGDHFGQAITLLAQTHRLPGMDGMSNRRFWQNDFPPARQAAAIRRSADRLLALVRPAIQHLQSCQKEATVNADLLDSFLHGARRMELIAQRMLDGLEAAQVYEKAVAAPAGSVQEKVALLEKVEEIVRRSRDAHQALGQEFARLWLADCKPYALDWTMKRYEQMVRWYDELLNKLAEAKKQLQAGRALPSAESLGLVLPPKDSRRTRPHRIEPQPLEPESVWLVPEASDRLGLMIGAGQADRRELPVQIDLSLPEGLADRAVRAFALSAGSPKPAPPAEASAGSAMREIPAQLDPSPDNPGQVRLSMLLPGPIGKGQSVAIWVYLGLPGRREASDRPVDKTTTQANSAGPSPTGEPPPGRSASSSTADPAETADPYLSGVRTYPAPEGGVWLENSQVRILLGPEGAHIYRWELKGRGGRDMTYPGQSGWAGFSDLGEPNRSARHQLQRLAGGPALVQYRAVDPQGLEKTISLFAGTSWVEVILSEPVRYYWDFDDPKNFAADGPTPGQYLFSNGQTGAVGRQADGVHAQVAAAGVHWAIKFNPQKLALGMVSPETPVMMKVAPGGGAGGVGIEQSPLAGHFITFAGLLQQDPKDLMESLRKTLDFGHPPEIVLYALQRKP